MSIGDGRRIDHGSRLECDVCIVGSGAAGITLALELIDSGLDVIVLEAGDRKPDPATQDLYDGVVVDPRLHSAPRYYRMRRFGGSTVKWGGGCIPLDPIDFEQRDYVPHSGWPFGREELDAYYPRANELLEAGDFAYDAVKDDGAPRELIAGYRSSRAPTDLLERNSPPTDFGRRYGERLRKASNVRVLLRSNCVHIAADPEGRRIDHVDVACLDGTRYAVAARDFVLATGGLETPRLLLASNDVYPAGIGNGKDLVGRYYMRHLSASIGRVELRSARDVVNYGIYRAPDGVYCRQLFSISEEQQRQHRIGNIIFRFWHPPIADPSHRSGALSAVFMIHSLFAYERKKWLRGESPTESHRVRHLVNILRDIRGTTAFTWHMLRHYFLARRKYPAVTPPLHHAWPALNYVSEQVPNRESRVDLSDRRDALGMRRIRIDWRYSDQDLRTIREGYRILAAELERTGVGRLHYDEREVETVMSRNAAYDGHQMGTTRMAADPAEGVVDPDCRVHGLENLYISSASVFPTGSHALPTLTIVALAVRLARHLRSRHAAGAPELAPSSSR